LGVVASLSPVEFSQSILSEDLDALMSISGIGKKGASRMVLELKDKVIASGGNATTGTRAKRAQSWRVAVGAGLSSLGWTARESEAAMDAVAENYPDLVALAEPDVGELLKASLRSLDRS
jgi:Holliday junction DNA helicase RuvA